MKRGFLGYSKKKPADSRTIRKSTREESIDTLQLVSDNTVHHGDVHHATIHPATIHPRTVHRDTVHPRVDRHCSSRVD